VGWTVPLAVWLGLLAGLIEGVLWEIKSRTVQQITFQSAQVLWMSPLSWLGFFLPAGLALWFAASRWPRVFSARVVTFALAALASWGVAMVFGRQLAAVAVYALALGIAVQLTRVLAGKPERTERLVRRTVWWLAAAVPALALWLNGGRALREWRMLASLPQPPALAPNVLLVVWDAARAHNMSLYGYPRPTSPRLAELASRGVRFDHAISPSAWTLAGHAAMFTGRSPAEVGVDWGSSLEGRHETLAEALRELGYATGAFVGNVFYATRATGLDQGFARYHDDPELNGVLIARSSMPGRYLFGMGGLVLRWLRVEDDPVRRHADDVSRLLLSWIARREGRPFFAFVNYYDTHDPYIAPPEYRERFITPLSAPADSADPERRERLRRARLVDGYDAAMAALDDAFGRLLDTLEARGVLRNTIVIVTSDHGEEFGDHGVFEHGKSLYPPVTHVPLVMAAPGNLPEGLTVSGPVSLRDIPATVLDLVGGEPKLPGSSLARFFRGDRPDAPVFTELTPAPGLPQSAPSMKGPMRAVALGRFYLIKSGDGSEELFDLFADPLAERNILASVAPESLAVLRQALDAEAARVARAGEPGQ
jgi:arylsulfatase A-like enzyme